MKPAHIKTLELKQKNHSESTNLRQDQSYQSHNILRRWHCKLRAAQLLLCYRGPVM